MSGTNIQKLMKFNVGIKHNNFLDDSDGDEEDVTSNSSKHKVFDDMVFESRDGTANSDTSFQYNYSTKPRRLRIKKKRKVEASPVLASNSLKRVADLPDSFRDVFDFEYFNKMQSDAFEHIYGGCDNNCVVAAPTGSGKTVLFELAILNCICKTADYRNLKILYVAPTKSLCMEKFGEWKTKFKRLSIGFLTSDTSVLDTEEFRSSNIVITTPEKWDVLTRKWFDNVKYFSMIRLCLIDEVHTIKDSRGPVLETVITRMKSLCENIRFIAVSATIPNIQDVADWLKDGKETGVLQYDDSYRAVQIEKHVIGYETSSKNDYYSELTYNKKLNSVLETYSNNKPVLIFCSTRSSASVTAKYLMNNYKTKSMVAGGAVEGISDIQLRECCKHGVGYHHAGLNFKDRKTVEELFLAGHVTILCSTSTLAMGVNLPAYLVVIKGTKMWSSSGYAEYSELDILQMIGRAGRPQFKKSGCAVIMTAASNELNYENLLSSSLPLESSLHLNLLENICAEIGLGTINSTDGVVAWLQKTFFYVRLQKNPLFYKIKDLAVGSVDRDLYRFCDNLVSILLEAQVVIETPDGKLQCTEYGTALSRHYVSLDTIKEFINVGKNCQVYDILSLLCKATEFSSLRIKHNEKTLYRELNQSLDVRFPFKDKGKVNPVIHRTEQKVSLILQLELGGIDIFAVGDFKRLYNAVSVDRFLVFRQCPRILKCMLDCFISKHDGISLGSCMYLLRSINGKCWEDSPMVLKQVEDIGLVSVGKFSKHGVCTISDAKSLTTTQIEYYLGLNVGGGLKIKRSIDSIPDFYISVGTPTVKPKGSSVSAKFQVKIKSLFSSSCWAGSNMYADIVCQRSDGLLVDFRRIAVSKLKDWKFFSIEASVDRSCNRFEFSIGCEAIAGVGERRSIDIKQHLPPSFEHLTNVLSATADADDDLEIVEMFQLKEHKHEGQKQLEGREMLRNGNYNCFHVCKDRTKCRHLCCKEGIPKDCLKHVSRNNTHDQDKLSKEMAVHFLESSRESSVVSLGIEDAVKPYETRFPITESNNLHVTVYEPQVNHSSLGEQPDIGSCTNFATPYPLAEVATTENTHINISSDDNLQDQNSSTPSTRTLDFLGSDIEFE